MRMRCDMSTRRPSHSRRSSVGQSRASQPDATSKHHRSTSTAPDPPSLLRLPSNSSYGAPSSPRARRATITNPTTPTLTSSQTTTSTSTPGQVSVSSATSASYFSPQSTASGKDARSPATRKPPAFFSGHGIDASLGPPNSLITRGNVDIARRAQTQSPAVAQQQLKQTGVVSPDGESTLQRRRRGPDTANELPPVPRQDSTKTVQRERPMESSIDGSDYGSGIRSQTASIRAVSNAPTDASGSEQGEDLFIAAASSPRHNGEDAHARAERLRSRIAARNNRQSFPTSLQVSSTPPPQERKLPSSVDTSQRRRASHVPSASRTLEQSPLSPASPLETPRSRLLTQSPKPALSSPRIRESDLSLTSKRRPSYPDAALTTPNRTQTFRPSNLQYSSSRDNPETPRYESPRYEAPVETASRADGTESLDSTGPAASVWDELDELKSRIRRIELGGKAPTTSAAAIASASGERPRTANTSITTVSSSPKRQRKTNGTPPESTASAQSNHKVHPLLREALAKAKHHVSPAIYRTLEATAVEALGMAELAGNAGPQGTLHSTSSILSGALVPDRHVRRKADNICRSLTELCIELCDTTPSLPSPAKRVAAALASSRRPSVQVNGESPHIRASIEPEEPFRSPSRAMSRIEARRTSLLTTKVNGSVRESSQEPPNRSQEPPSSAQSQRMSRAGTSLLTRRRSDEDDEDPTLRAPSRALTDFRDIRSADHTNRYSRENARQPIPDRFIREQTPREPMPDLQPSPSIQYAPSRRPTVSGHENNHHLLFRDGARRYDMDRQNSPRLEFERQSSPAYEKQATADHRNRLAQAATQYTSNRVSLGAMGASIGRTASVNRRVRGTSAGE